MHYIVANFGLVRKIANKLYQKYAKYISGVIDIDDLYNCGMTGLVRAIERFDFNKYAEFSVYATYWIHQRIVRELYNNMGQFRIPIYKLQQLLKKSTNPNDLLSINYYGIDQIHDEDVNFIY